MQTQFLSLTQAASLLSSGGKKPSTCTLWRWCRKGCNGVTLKYSKFGREIRVTEEALENFGRELAAADAPLPEAPAPKPKPKPRTAARRQKDIAAANEVLKREGVLR